MLPLCDIRMIAAILTFRAVAHFSIPGRPTTHQMPAVPCGQTRDRQAVILTCDPGQFRRTDIRTSHHCQHRKHTILMPSQVGV